MSIQLQKQDEISEKLTIVRQLYERFNDDYGTFFDMNKVNDAIKNIVMINDDMSNIPSSVKTFFQKGAKGISGDNKIYIKSDVAIDVLFHEILHYITEDHRGVQIPLINTYSEEEIADEISKYGENRFIRQIEQLDESITRFITELAIPEAEIEDSYGYGANVIRDYYNSLADNGIKSDFIFDMYINGNQEDIEKFKGSFGEKFNIILDNIERANNFRLYIFKTPNNPIITEQELMEINDNAAKLIKVK